MIFRRLQNEAPTLRARPPTIQRTLDPNNISVNGGHRVARAPQCTAGGVTDQLTLGFAIPLNWNQLRRKARVTWTFAMRSVWQQKEDKSLCTDDGS